MEFVLTNKRFEEMGLGNLNYLSNYSMIQKEQYPHDFFKEELELMLRTNLKNKIAKPIVIIRSEIDGVQMFDQEFLLHLQSMSPELLYYGKAILKEGESLLGLNTQSTGTIQQTESDEAIDETDWINPSQKQQTQKGFYSGAPLYKCSYEMPRNRYCNIVFKLFEMDGIHDFYCQIYYCGPNLFSRSLTQKLTFKLSPFLEFLENHSDTLHLYFNSRSLINKRFGRSKYYLQKIEVDQRPTNYNKKFLDDNCLQTEYNA